MTTNQAPKRDPLEVLHSEIQDELSKWQEAGMSPEGIKIDHFLNVKRLDTIVKLLIDKGILDEKELNLEFAKHLLEQLQEIRTQNEDAVRRAQTLGRLFGPNGQPLQ